jgi:molybdopterin/thiamine biosynthesis adenylyltransferase
MKKSKERDDLREIYHRMLLIPHWDYEKCASLSLVIVGMSGLGAPLLQLLALLGIGEKGITTLIDPDIIETSNRSRIPYATPKDDGKPKVEVAEKYVAAIRPKRQVRPLCVTVFEEEAQRAIAESDIIIGAVDSELARMVMNYCAHAFCLPYFDAGSGILVSSIHGETLVHSGGQVRIVVPSMTPCLLCNLGIERAEVDRELMQQFVRKDINDTTFSVSSNPFF